MDWAVTVWVSDYLPPAQTNQTLLREKGCIGYLVHAPSREAAVLMACQMAARHGMPTRAQVEYDW